MTDINLYKSIIDFSPLGYAYHKIVKDNKGNPCDSIFIERGIKIAITFKLLITLCYTV